MKLLPYFCLGAISIGITAARQMLSQLLKITTAAAVSPEEFFNMFFNKLFPLESNPPLTWQTVAVLLLWKVAPITQGNVIRFPLQVSGFPRKERSNHPIMFHGFLEE